MNLSKELRLELAKSYILAGQNLVSVNAFRAFIGMIALLLIWFGPLELLNRDINKQKESQKESLNDSRKLFSEKVGQLELKTDDKYSKTTRNMIINETKLQDIRADKIKKNVKDITIKFLGFEIKTLKEYSFVIWCVILIALLWYIYHLRKTILSLYSKAFRIQKEEDGFLRTDPCEIIVNTPWWLAPLPIKDGKCVLNNEFSKAVGWQRRGLFSRNLILLALIFIFSIHLRVVYIGFDAIPYLTGIALNSSILLGILIFSTVISSVIFYFWIFSLPVPDRFPEESDKITFERREIIKSIVVGASIITIDTILIMLQRFNLMATIKDKKNELRKQIKYLERPRYRKRKPKYVNIEQETGFYLNKKSNVVHYVSGDGHLRGYGLKKENLIKIENEYFINNVKPMHKPKLSTVSFAFENTALTFLPDDPISACRCLFKACQYDLKYKIWSTGEPSIRLYDLLAGISIRFPSCNKYKRMLIDEIINKSWAKQELSERIDKWNKKDGKWYKKWINKENLIVWYSSDCSLEVSI